MSIERSFVAVGHDYGQGDGMQDTFYGFDSDDIYACMIGRREHEHVIREEFQTALTRIVERLREVQP